MKTKKYNIKVKRLVMVWMHEEYEVEAMCPDDAKKQVDFGRGTAVFPLVPIQEKRAAK